MGVAPVTLDGITYGIIAEVGGNCQGHVCAFVGINITGPGVIAPPLNVASTVALTNPVHLGGFLSPFPQGPVETFEGSGSATVVLQRRLDLELPDGGFWFLQSATYDLQPTPEPATLVLVVSTALGIGLVRRRKGRSPGATRPRALLGIGAGLLVLAAAPSASALPIAVSGTIDLHGERGGVNLSGDRGFTSLAGLDQSVLGPLGPLGILFAPGQPISLALGLFPRVFSLDGQNYSVGACLGGAPGLLCGFLFASLQGEVDTPPLVGVGRTTTVSAPVTFGGFASFPGGVVDLIAAGPARAQLTLLEVDFGPGPPFDPDAHSYLYVSLHYELEPTPEPTTLLLWGTTAGGLGLIRWLRRRARGHEHAA
jgi:hypothetical protein